MLVEKAERKRQKQQQGERVGRRNISRLTVAAMIEDAVAGTVLEVTVLTTDVVREAAVLIIIDHAVDVTETVIHLIVAALSIGAVASTVETMTMLIIALEGVIEIVEVVVAVLLSVIDAGVTLIMIAIQGMQAILHLMKKLGLRPLKLSTVRLILHFQAKLKPCQLLWLPRQMRQVLAHILCSHSNLDQCPFSRSPQNTHIRDSSNLGLGMHKRVSI